MYRPSLPVPHNVPSSTNASLSYVSDPAEGSRVSDYVAPASRAKPAQTFKQLMHPEINLIERLRNAHDPSRIAFFLRMLEMDPDSNGVLSEEEINRDTFTEFLDKEKTVFANVMTNISIISALLAFTLFEILTGSNAEPSVWVPDAWYPTSETDARGLLFWYICLFHIASTLAVFSMFTCVLWLMEIQGFTPTNEDGIWCIINNNTNIPLLLLVVSTFFTAFGGFAMLWIIYGSVIGWTLLAGFWAIFGPWAYLHLSGLP